MSVGYFVNCSAQVKVLFLRRVQQQMIYTDYLIVYFFCFFTDPNFGDNLESAICREQ
jgi:hypothetical protein